MATFLFVLAVVALLAVVAHAVLIWLSFRVSKQWGLAALLLPPVAWIAPFRGHAPRRVLAGIALASLLGSAAFLVYGLRELAHAIAVAGTSVGEPRPK